MSFFSRSITFDEQRPVGRLVWIAGFQHHDIADPDVRVAPNGGATTRRCCRDGAAFCKAAPPAGIFLLKRNDKRPASAGRLL